MIISKSDAAEALSDIERAARRTHTQRGYRIAGPILILWGAIWLAGYGGMGVLPGNEWAWIWLPLDIIGIAGTIFLALRGRRAATGAPGGWESWRPMVWGLAIFAFIVATYAMFRPDSASVYLAWPGLVTGFAYVVFGLMRMPRLAWIGAAMFAATLAGFFLFEPVLAFWMAGVGGVGLILGGLWLRRA